MSYETVSGRLVSQWITHACIRQHQYFVESLSSGWARTPFLADETPFRVLEARLLCGDVAKRQICAKFPQLMDASSVRHLVYGPHRPRVDALIDASSAKNRVLKRLGPHVFGACLVSCLLDSHAAEQSRHAGHAAGPCCQCAGSQLV